ncbi:biotin-dependent carboxyltransferase family protein [Herbidospora galbida]|uniref:Biotin-dependent carboxyltransferase family protein n=1 Tax=Herbidospora galbida TaxID=2575442 RepID=A0A4U3MF95_9ACTN|nr:biotin-dependent carboxyltransferase family protein [Herbidospora galbida]TKK87229.1 biotin-dependent carboxyltransferase family protein [Herbidospora galbida]
MSGGGHRDPSGAEGRDVEVVVPGPYATVQDFGRRGFAHLGVPRSGAADLPSLRLANRLVGNAEDAAAIELTFGGATLRFGRGAWVALAGAPAPTSTGGMWAPFWVAPGRTLEIGAPYEGLRTYVAVRGGICVPPVLGSRSTDSLSGLGPAPLAAGTVLPLGEPMFGLHADVAPQRPISADPAVEVVRGPRDDWFTDDGFATLCAGAYRVSQDSNRVGARLTGTALRRARTGELPSEGMVAGAIQVPPDGQPIVFLADHPPTGGYPVIGVVTTADLPKVAQLRPGDRLRFRPVRPGSPRP